MPKSKSYSISEARSHLAQLVLRAERGQAVRLTRRGHLVAAIVSIEDWKAVKKNNTFFDRLMAFYEENPDNPLKDHDLDNLRDQKSGRDFSWQG